MSSISISKPQASRVSPLFSTPELWSCGVLNHLDFSSIKLLELVNHFLRDQALHVTSPSQLGSIPITVWSQNILPLLSYRDLKKFQRVSQVAKKLTLSEERAPALFRSDVDASLLKKIKTGTLLGSMWSSDLNLTKGIHPFLSSGAPSYIVGGTYEDLMVITYNNQDSSDHPDKYKFFSENATNPPVSTLKVNAFDEDLFRKPPKYQVSVTGTGRPLFGGELRAVTCKDVMLAVTEYGEKFSYYMQNDIICHYAFAGFGSFKKTGRSYLLGGASWDS